MRELAEQVRSRVSGQASDLRAELKAAAQQARRDATPVGGFEAWNRHDPKGIRDLELAVHELRQEARAAWKRHGLTTEQSREIVQILTDASQRMREVFTQR